MTKIFLLILACLPIIFVSSFAQQGRGNRGAESPSTNSTPSRQLPGLGGSSPAGQGTTQQSGASRTVFLRGKVMLADGSVLLESVKVQMLCEGVVRKQVYSSPKGEFSINLGDGQTGTMDASMSNKRTSPGLFGGSLGQGIQHGRLGTVDLNGCDLRAGLPGFRSEVISLGIRGIFETNVGVILLHRLNDVEGTTISLTAQRAPRNARKAYEKARKEFFKKKPKYGKVMKQLQKAVKVYPNFATAWQLIGQTQLKRNNEKGARMAFEKAMTADPNFLLPYLSLVNLELNQRCWDCMTKLTTKALELNPNFIDAHYFHAVASFEQGKQGVAKFSARKVTESQKRLNFPVAHYILGVLLAQEGQYQLAAPQFLSFLEARPDAQGADHLKQQLKSWSEQGRISASILRTN